LIDFTGTALITPTLPNGWIMQGNKSKMLLIRLQGAAVQALELFTYKGTFKIKKIVVGNKEGKQILCNIQNVSPAWTKQNWSMDIESDSWDNFKDKSKKGIINKTKYKLPDYGLPKVDKIKKQKRLVKKTNYSSTNKTSSGTTGGGY